MVNRDKAVARLLCAVDTTDLEKATELAGRLHGHVGALKLGLEFFCSHGPRGVRQVIGDSHGLFLDLKLHDIPNTVAGGMRGIAPLRPFLTTIHASGGAAMMAAAVEAAAMNDSHERTKVIAVTMLTSMDASDVEAVGMRGPAADQVLRLADLALEAGVDGVVCSPLETARLRSHCGPEFLLVVPGIRPASAERGDQKRVMTPREAVEAGASYIVVGRPITQAADPVAAADAIVADIGG